METVRYIRQLMIMKTMSVRTYSLLLIQGFVMYVYVKPAVRFSQAVMYPLSPWGFPFILSNIYFLFLFLLEIIYYFSNVPFMQYANMYQIIRIGRKKWAAGHMVSIFFQSFLIMAVNFGFSVLWMGKNCQWGTEWGKALHTLALTNAQQYYGLLFHISYDSLQQYSPMELLGYTMLIGTLTISFLGLFMFMFSIVWSRTAAVVGAVVMTAGIYLVENIHPLLSQKAAMFFPACWLRTANIGVKVHGSSLMPPMSYILAALVIGLALMCGIIIWRVGKIEFQWQKEDEM